MINQKFILIEGLYLDSKYSHIFYISKNIYLKFLFKKLFNNKKIGDSNKKIKYSNLVIKIQILKKNIGFYCMASMLFLQIIFLFVHMIKGLKGIKYYMLIFQSKNIKNNLVVPPKRVKILKIK